MSIVIYLLVLLGVATLTHYIYRLIQYIAHYLKFKSFPMTIEEQRNELLSEENKKLLHEIQILKEEAEKVTTSILQRLYNK